MSNVNIDKETSFFQLQLCLLSVNMILISLPFSYGDFLTNTFLGRLFTVFWSLAGLVITSMIMGFLMDSLTATVMLVEFSSTQNKVRKAAIDELHFSKH